MKTLALQTGIITFAAAELYLLHLLYKTINADGTWYNQLYTEHGRKNVKFHHKLKATINHNARNLNYTKTLLGFTIPPLTLATLTTLTTQGILTIL